MKKQTFIDLLSAYRTFLTECQELDSMGFDFYDGKYQLATRTEKVLNLALESAFKPEGTDWIYWFMYENDFGDKKLEANDGEKLICQDVEGLYKYVKKYRK